MARKRRDTRKFRRRQRRAATRRHQTLEQYRLANGYTADGRKR